MPSRRPAFAFLTIGPIAATLSAATAAPDEPADTMHDVRDHFAACFQPPHEMAGARVTFYFSINAKGQVTARPRTVLFEFKGSQADRSRYVASFAASFSRCLPLTTSRQLAASIPGKVYFLQYVMAESGTTREVLLRPFGSHGGGGPILPPGGEPEPFEPAPGAVGQVLVGQVLVGQARIPLVPAWQVRPPIRPLFPQRRFVLPIPPRPADGRFR